MVLGGLGKVLSGPCGEVVWSGQILAASGSTPSPQGLRSISYTLEILLWYFVVHCQIKII